MSISRTTLAIAAAAGFLFGSNVLAAAWGDSSQSTGVTTISSEYSTTPTVLTSVTVTCPKAGSLMVFAETGVWTYSSITPGTATIGFSITTTTRLDTAHYRYLSQYLNTGTGYTPAGMQRTDSCTSGQTITYRFVAWRSGAASPTFAFQPRINVIFVDQKI